MVVVIFAIALITVFIGFCISYMNVETDDKK